MFGLLLLVILSISFVDSRSHQLLNSDYQNQHEVKQNLRNALRGGYSLIVDEDGDRLVEIVPNGLCYIYANKLSVSKIVEEHPESVQVVPATAMKTVIKACSQLMVENLELYTSSLKFGNKFLDPIFPGTLWCGSGDIAEHDDELGWFEDTDMCCRTHDKCPEDIKAGETRYNLTNDNSYTISHCDCDIEFTWCLLDTDRFVSDIIGWIFFPCLGGECFREDYPIIGCNEYGGLFDLYCADYELNMTQPEIYQFFENPYYGCDTRKLETTAYPTGTPGKQCRRNKNKNINKKQLLKKLWSY